VRLVRSLPDGVVQARALNGEIVSSWARHVTLTVPLSTQLYKWVLMNLMLGITLQWTYASHFSGGRGGGGGGKRERKKP